MYSKSDHIFFYNDSMFIPRSEMLKLNLKYVDRNLLDNTSDECSAKNNDKLFPGGESSWIEVGYLYIEEEMWLEGESRTVDIFADQTVFVNLREYLAAQRKYQNGFDPRMTVHDVQSRC